MSIESKVAETLLQEEFVINLAGVEYLVAPPTLATLLLVSREVAKLPKLDKDLAGAEAMNALLTNGESLAPLARIVAILIVGGKRIRDARRHFWQLWRPKNKVEKIANRVKYECTPKELSNAIITLLGKMQLSDFFVISVSLANLNISKRTTETETIARGQ